MNAQKMEEKKLIFEEFELLALLASKTTNGFLKNEIFDKVWGT